MCGCNKEMMEDAERRAVKRVAPYMCDVDGDQLFYVDSFGMRGPLPGECKECYGAYKKAYFKSTEGMWD